VGLGHQALFADLTRVENRWREIEVFGLRRREVLSRVEWHRICPTYSDYTISAIVTSYDNDRREQSLRQRDARIEKAAH
jgi:hypothetical protein